MAQSASTDVHARLRAAVAEADVRIYILAALIPAHPSQVSDWLHGRRPVTAETEAKVLGAIARARSGAVPVRARRAKL